MPSLSQIIRLMLLRLGDGAGDWQVLRSRPETNSATRFGCPPESGPWGERRPLIPPRAETFLLRFKAVGPLAKLAVRGGNPPFHSGFSIDWWLRLFTPDTPLRTLRFGYFRWHAINWWSATGK